MSCNNFPVISHMTCQRYGSTLGGAYNIKDMQYSQSYSNNRVSITDYVRGGVCIHTIDDTNFANNNTTSKLCSLWDLRLYIGKESKRTCIAPIVSISTTKRSDLDHTELPANTPHLPFFSNKYSLEGETAANSLFHLANRYTTHSPSY